VEDAEELGKFYYNLDDDVRGGRERFRMLEQKYLGGSS
jgi:hypothetical protein